MKTKVSIQFLWFVMIASRLLFWAIAYFVVLPHGSPSATAHLDYMLTAVALALAAGSSFYYLKGNTSEELIAYSKKVLTRGRQLEGKEPSALHGYQSKTAFAWALSQWMSVLGIIAAQVALPLNFVHGFCGLSLVMVIWHRPQLEIVNKP